MFRVFVLSLLVAAVSAADDNQEAKDASSKLLAYQNKLGLPQDKLSCHSLCVDKKRIKFTLLSMPSHNTTWDGSQAFELIPEYDPSLMTQIIISDMLQSEQVFKPTQLAFTYGVRGNRMNVISVNWDEYSYCQEWDTVHKIVPQLATIISDMIKNMLVAKNEMDYGKLRLTGAGFGAHIAGLTARKLPQKPARISALDPTGRLFETPDGQSFQLMKSDAKFVDTIVTNQRFYGMKKLIGDINFLPNGGRAQKACENKSELGADSCSHHLAIEYWLESVNKGYSGFVAKPAQSWQEFLQKKNFLKQSEIMGENVSKKLKGNYYLEVNVEAPYSRGVNGAYLFRPEPEDPVQKGIFYQWSKNQLPSNESPFDELIPPTIFPSQ